MIVHFHPRESYGVSCRITSMINAASLKVSYLHWANITYVTTVHNSCNWLDHSNMRVCRIGSVINFKKKAPGNQFYGFGQKAGLTLQKVSSNGPKL
jgi:hypothetical protein